VSVPDFHTFGGLRLESSPTESLVVKAFTEIASDPAGFYANGSPLEIQDRIGGTLQVLGQPGFPVVVTSLRDDSVGAGTTPEGDPLKDTNNDGDSSPGNDGGAPSFPPATGPLKVTYDNNATNLVNAIRLRPLPGGVTIPSATYVGDPKASGTYINGDSVPLGMTSRGILLTSGDANIPATNTQPGFTGGNGLPGDADLDALAGYATEDATSLTLTINVTSASGIKSGAFSFVFGSEEYPEFVGSSFNDVLGGFINGGAATNFIRDSQGGLVSINSGFFDRDNQSNQLNVEYDGLTRALTATFPLQVGTNVLKIAIGDASDDILDSGVFITDLRFGTKDVGTGGVGALPGAGDWEGVTIDKYANDRNVDSILEQEDPTLAAPGSNATPITSQQLGALAPDEKSGDENRRLGFTVQGQLNSRNDVDVYSFTADAGTEVWVDIDRTTYALDSVVELIDSDGVLLARSNNSYLEDKGTQGLVGDARLMRRTPPFEGRDFYSISATDAGMRVILPGPAGTNAAYFVRVRSSSNTINDLTTGLTSGAYQLQLRLQEKDEIAGSVLRLADVRYATNGISVLGHPAHSPLTGEHADVENNGGANDSQATAQNIGNVAAVDRGSTSVAGHLSGPGDVDWYQFNLDIRGIQGPNAAQPATQALYSMMFDVDYADGFGRPNTQINVYNAAGQLILTSRDSNIADDRPSPLSAADLEDLLRGSAGAADPSIGPTYLAAGIDPATTTTYYVAVSGDSVLPAQWDQFFAAAPTNPLVRFAPADSVTRVVDDPINVIPSTTSTANKQILFDDTSAVPFNLGDVSLYVQREGGNPRPYSSDIVTVDPFTGANAQFVGTVNADLHDIAFRPTYFTPSTGPNVDKNLFAYGRDIRQPGITPTDAASGHFWQIDTGDATQSVDRGDDGIVTYELYPQAGQPPKLDVAHDIGGTKVGYGIQFEGLAFGSVDQPGMQLFAVGNRGENYTANPQINPYITQRQNLLFQMQANEQFPIPAGQPLVNGGPGTIPTSPPTYFGAYASAFEYGEILTAPVLTAADATTVANPFNISDNGTTFSVANKSGFVTFEFDAGPDVQENFSLAQAQTIQDGDFFVVDPDNTPDNGNETWFQFDTGSVITVGAAAPTAIPDGATVSVNDTNGKVVTYEFDRDGNAQNSNTVLVDIAGLGNPGLIAGNLADAINASFANGDLNCQAFVARDRISLTNDLSIQLSPQLDIQGVMGVASSSGSSPLLQAVAGSQLTDGMTFSINRVNRPPQVFEFDSNGVVASGHTAVPFTPFDNANTVANSMNVAIGNAFSNQITHNVQNNGSIVLISGQTTAGGPLFNQGTSPILDLRVTKAALFGPNIQVEETDSPDVVGQAVKLAVETNTPYTVGASLNRINFPPPVDPPEAGLSARQPIQRLDVSGMVAQVPGGNNSTLVWQQRVGSATGTSNGNTPIPFLAEDLAATDPFNPAIPGIATRIEVALNKVFGANFAQARFDRVYLSGDSNFSAVSLPLTARGEGPGGMVTGLTVLNNTLYAISDGGGLYVVTPDSFGNQVAQVSDPSKVDRVTTTYVATSRSELEGLHFTALTTGPRDVEPDPVTGIGRYSNLLFGLTDQGRLYAFDTDGHLQPIFAGGVTNIQLTYREPTTGIVGPLTNATGLAFSDLDINLWHVTPFTNSDPSVDYQRQTDVGHGGNSSLYFGDPNLAYPILPGGDREAKLGTAATPFRSYDAPGGAHGTVVSNEFSLVGKTAADQPMLYYTYYSETDNLTDTLRVFISGSDPENNFNSGDWHMLGDSGSAPSGLGSQMFANSGNWRQVRIPLADYAGLDHLRLRIDFTTAADMDVGKAITTGDELRTVAGQFINDGDTFALTNPNQTFEFNSGYTIVAPAGVAIKDGDTFTIRKDFNNGAAQQKIVVFEFDRSGGVNSGNYAIPVTDADTASDIARKIVSAIKANFGQTDTAGGKAQTNSVVPRWLGDNKINIDFATQVTRTAGSALTTVGTPVVGTGHIEVPVNPLMSREDVAQVIDGILENYFYSQTIVVRGSGTAFDDGDQFTIGVGNQTFNFEWETGFVVNVPPGGGGSGGGAKVNDGDTIRLRRIVNGNVVGDFTFEFDSDSNLAVPTHLRVPFVTSDTQLEVATALVTAINTQLTAAQRTNLGIIAGYPQVVSGGRVQIGGGAGLTVTTSGAFSTTGSAGTAAGYQPVLHVPSFFTSPAQVAQELNAAFNNASGAFNQAGFSSNYSANDPARVQLRGVTVDRFKLSQNPVDPMTLETSNDVVKSYKDLIRIINHKVSDRGPLGLANSLPGDLPDLDPAGNPQGFIGIQRGQNNQHEGVYIDDIVIGFAERGEVVTGATATNNYVANPFLAGNQIVTGDYQLEMRRGPDFAPQSIDTNDRLDKSLVITAPAGADISDGKTFTLSDGINQLTFEFDLASDNKVTTGNVRIPFSVTDRPEVIAKKIREAINSTPVQAVLKISAQVSDGTLFGQTTGGPYAGRPSNANQVNIIGAATLEPLGDPAPEPNELKAQAISLDLSTQPTRIINGTIGDNTSYPVTQDYDLYKIFLNAGQRIYADIDAQQFGSPLNSRLRLFNSAGVQIKFSDDDPATGERGDTIDSWLQFTATTAGTYYIGVSGSGNNSYNISNGQGTLPGSAGSYQLEVSLAPSSSTEVVSPLVNQPFDGSVASVPFERSGYTWVPFPPFLPPPQSIQRVALEAGVTYYFDVDSADGMRLDSILQIFAPNGTVVATNDNGTAPGETPNGDSYLEFTPTTSGVYTVKVSSKFTPFFDGYVTLFATTTPPSALDVRVNNDRYGDNNQVRDQGEIILDGNRVSSSANWGILIDDSARDNGGAPHQSPPRVLREINTQHLVPGVVVMNNVVSNNGFGGIRYSGSTNAAGQEIGAVPFGRIINNTVYGKGPTGNDVGILVDGNASPTLLNNIVANFQTGISVAANSNTTVLGGTVYQGNGANTAGITVGADAFVLNNAAPLFVNPAIGNFYLAEGSLAIDSSIDSLLDRPAMQTIRDPLGIPPSPILAPDKDATGALRVDDPSVDSPGGSGSNVFKDRGALDRVDFVGPTSTLLNPRDNDDLGFDGDPTLTKVVLGNITLFTFEVQLNDAGIGIDDSTVTSSQVVLTQTKGGVTKTLVNGTDYVFSYDSTNNKIILRPTGGIWPLNTNYKITLNNSATGIKDLAGNLLQPDRVNGTVVYEIFLGTAVDYGDAPNSYGTTKAVGGASHQLKGIYRLGKQVSADTDGQPSVGANADNFDDGLKAYFLSPGLTSSLTVLAQGGGKLDAWLDKNKDGDFLDAGEHIIVATTLPNNVQKKLTFKFGNTVDVKGDTYLRLRYTSTGINSPVGPANDGEVEDYKVTMSGPKYQNPNNRYDVDGNGFVQPRDALLIVNLLNNFDTDGDGVVNPFTDLGTPAPNPPPFYDVSGDNLITRADALLVVNFINSQASPAAASATVSGNHAPLLDASPDTRLNSITANPAGTQVQQLVAKVVADVDPQALKGIAVVGASGTGSGVWQYKLDNQSWKPLGVVSESAARLLPARAYVRFVPASGFSGDAKLYYRAWDQTQGTVGGLFNTVGHRGGNNAFSLDFESAILTVMAPSAAAGASATFASSSILYDQKPTAPTAPAGPTNSSTPVASQAPEKKSTREEATDSFFDQYE
jgi:hypothetical protein